MAVYGVDFLLLYQHEEAEAGGQGSSCAATIRVDSGLPPSLRRRDLPGVLSENVELILTFFNDDLSDATRSNRDQAYSQREEFLREERRHVDQREKVRITFCRPVGNSLAWYRTTAAAR